MNTPAVVDPRLGLIVTTTIETASLLVEQEFDTYACRVRLVFGKYEYAFTLWFKELEQLRALVAARAPVELLGGALRLMYDSQPPCGWRCVSLTTARSHRIPAGVLETLSPPPATLHPSASNTPTPVPSAPWPPHLLVERLSARGLDLNTLAQRMGVKPYRLKEVVRGERRIAPIEEFIAGELGASRLAIFGPNGREKAAMAAAERRSS